MGEKWTEPQKKVIKHSAGNLLVSASAGSGKTSVLIEKIITLILSGQVHLKNLLIVTFTNAASLEIRQRLQKSLSVADNQTLLAELEDLSTSDILTFDAFCIKIVKEFGYEIGKDNNFTVADTTLAGFLQNQALDNIISKHGKNLDEDFTNVLDTFFAGRNDKDFRHGIISLYNFLKSKDDDTVYLKRLDEFFDLSEKNKNSELFKFLHNYVLSVKNNFLSKIKRLITLCSNQDEKLKSALQNAKQMLELLSDDFYKNLLIIQNQLNFDVVRASQKDTFEILEIKKEYANAKNEFLADLNLIFSKEIRALSLEQMQKDIFATKQRLLSLFNLVNEFDEEYSKIKANMQVLDFIDIEQLANKILNNSNIATALQNRYDWIFIDEYQDTSLLQEDIVKKITAGDNLFMVGDFKQSIYRFRQAEPKIFINKYNQYKKMQNLGNVIELKTNFRSDKAIINFNNFVFDKIYKNSIDDFEYSGNADLEFGGSYESDVEPKVKLLVIQKDGENITEETEQQSTSEIVQIFSNKKTEVYSVKDSELTFDKTDDIKKEALLLASEIKDMLNKKYYDAKSDSYKNITFGDMAVLSRSKNNVLPKIRQILNEAGIPVSTTYEDALFDNYDMQILMNIIRTIENYKNDVPLISSLSNIGCLSFDELSTIRSLYSKEEFFYEAVEKYKIEHADVISQKLSTFYDKLYFYKNISTYKDICELINIIVEKENLDTYFAINNYGSEFESHLNLLMDSLISIKNYSLFEFINYIDTYGSELKFDNTIKDGENSVTLCTIHKSKGLEYPVVFLIGCAKPFSTKGETEKLLMDNDWGICMPSYDLELHKSYDNLPYKAFKQKIKSENRKENKRLLYVALTRAKNYLTIIGSCNTTNVKSLKSDYEIFKANNYLDWMLGCLSEEDIKQLNSTKYMLKNLGDEKSATNIEIKYVNYDDFEFEPMQLNNIKPEQLKIDSEEFMNTLKYKFEQNNLAKKNTVSQIMAEEEHYNISNFNYKKTDKFGDDDFLSIGTAYHKYMQYLNFTNDESDITKQIANLKDANIITTNESNLVDENEIVTAILQLNKLIDNRDNVSKEKQFLAYMPANQLINTIQENKILIQGVADLIIIKSDEIYLIDYKTSRLKTDEDFIKKYSTQLNIYARAIEQFYKLPVSKKIIYSFYLSKLIII